VTPLFIFCLYEVFLASYEHFAACAGHECRGRQGVNFTLHQDVSAADQVMHVLNKVCWWCQHITYPAVGISDALSLNHRRRPFLIKSLENTLSKLLKSLDFYDNAARHKVAIGMSRLLLLTRM